MRTSPCIVYMPRINQWWDILSESLKTTLMTTIQNLDPSSPILLLATSEEPLKQIDVWVSRIVMLYFDVDFSSVWSEYRISRYSRHKSEGLESSIYRTTIVFRSRTCSDKIMEKLFKSAIPQRKKGGNSFRIYF